MIVTATCPELYIFIEYTHRTASGGDFLVFVNERLRVNWRRGELMKAILLGNADLRE